MNSYRPLLYLILAKSASSQSYIEAKKELTDYYKKELERKAAAEARFKPKPKAPEKKNLKKKALELQERVQKSKETMDKLASEEYWKQKQKELRRFKYEEWKHERKRALRRKRKEKQKNKSILGPLVIYCRSSG